MGSKKNKNKVNKSETTYDSIAEENDKITENTKVNDSELEENTITPTKGLKRSNDDYDSDSDNEKPKKPKKKKKQQPVVEEPGGKKVKKSIRQMKREKFAQRQAEAQAASKDQLKSQCLNYLSQWKHDRQNWKFMKAKQVWVYKNKFSPHLIPDSIWPVFLEYFESATGNIKNMLLNDANKIIKQMDDWTESQNKEGCNDNEDQATMEDNGKPDDIVYNRARSIIQCLQE